jgi:hypothetical protein
VTPAREGTTSTAKRQQQQVLCGKAIKVAGNETRNTAVNVSFGDNINLVVVKGPQVAVVLASRSGSKGLQGFGNTGPYSEPYAITVLTHLTSLVTLPGEADWCRRPALLFRNPRLNRCGTFTTSPIMSCTTCPGRVATNPDLGKFFY